MLNPLAQYVAILQKQSQSISSVEEVAKQFARTTHEQPLHVEYRDERPILEVGPELWRDLFTVVKTQGELFAWESRIPKYDCPCSSFYSNWKSINMPTFPLSNRWKYNLKSAVNAKLNKPNLSWQEACQVWGWDEPIETLPLYPSQKTPPVRLERKNAIVTALSPNRIDRQVLCIKTWLASGFKVIANQTDKEMESFPKVFHEISDLIEWRVNNDVESFYDFKTQKIRNLLAIEDVILINSDCEMAGEYDWQSGDTSTFFLRWNYKPGKEPREFEWGIDGAWLTREAWAALPEDFPYCIGQAMWDYAVPHILNIKGIPFKIEHKAWLFHEEHKQNWTQVYWQKGADWLEANGYYSELQYSDGFRQSLDPDWYYDYNRGFWIKKDQ
jgi:hypothetical protein